jgi:hypothetical protein
MNGSELPDLRERQQSLFAVHCVNPRKQGAVVGSISD